MKEYRIQNTEYRPNQQNRSVSASGLSALAVCFLLALAVCMTACRPRGILTSRQMREVLVDLHKTDALLQVHGLQYGHDQEEDRYYAAVLEEHGVTQAQFDSSIVWYTHHPKLFDKIYPKVLRQLHDDYETFVALHPESMGPQIQAEDELQQPTLTAEEAQLRIDSLCWTMRHGAPVYGWHEGWKRKKEPKVPFVISNL